MISNFLFAVLSNMDPAKEELLLNKIALKNEEALEELYDKYSRVIYSFALKILKTKEDAEEVLQNVFLQIWNKAPTFDVQKGSLYSWLITITRNSAIDKLRSKNFKTHSLNISLRDELLLDGASTLDSAIVNERASIVKNALDKIPHEQKLVIELAFFEGFTQNEISEKLKVPLGTVKTRTRQGMIKLQSILSEYF